MKIMPVILCGELGSRLWALSSQNFPKHFLNLVGDSTLFQQNISRAAILESNAI
jgi:mannose-1-phosphate guanylyltransferase